MNALKKTLVLLLVAFMGVGIANAQFKFGVKAGLNVNNLHLNNPGKMFDADNGTGWTAGVMTEFEVPIVGLCLDLSLMYTRMNADVNVFDSNGYEGTIKNKNFIQIPLNIKYKFKLPVVSSFLAPYLFTGPDFSFKLDKGTFHDMKTKTCQVAWNVGLGIELVRHLQIGASYGFGINNIAQNFGVNTTSDVKLKNNYWTITAAYLF